MTAIYDISIPIADRMIAWPGDPDVRVERVMDVCCGDAATVARFEMGSHTGTHVDAFSHFKRDGQTLDAMDLTPYLGPALVVYLPEADVIEPAHLDFLKTEKRPIERILFRTKNSDNRWWEKPFNKNFVHISPEAAEVLAQAGVQLLGIDYLSVEGYHCQGAPTHHCLMDAGIYIVEGLDLSKVSGGWYELICLPLKVKDGDGAPARVILRDLLPENKNGNQQGDRHEPV